MGRCLRFCSSWQRRYSTTPLGRPESASLQSAMPRFALRHDSASKLPCAGREDGPLADGREARGQSSSENFRFTVSVPISRRGGRNRRRLDESPEASNHTKGTKPAGPKKLSGKGMPHEDATRARDETGSALIFSNVFLFFFCLPRCASSADAEKRQDIGLSLGHFCGRSMKSRQAMAVAESRKIKNSLVALLDLAPLRAELAIGAAFLSGEELPGRMEFTARARSSCRFQRLWPVWRGRWSSQSFCRRAANAVLVQGARWGQPKAVVGDGEFIQ